MYTELLKLCAFEPGTIEKERSRVDRAFEIWGIGLEDVKRAEAKVKRYFGPSAPGVHQWLGIWLEEFVDLTLAKEEGKQVVYCSYPPVPQIASTFATVSEDVYCVVPETVIEVVMGMIFGKLSPVLEAAEEYWLPPGQGHCPLLQTRLGAIILGKIPKPDLLVPSGVTCDQAGKTDELIGWLYGIPVVHLDTTNDEVGGDWPTVSPRRVHYLVQEMKNAGAVFQQVTGHAVTDETLEHVIGQYTRLSSVQNQIMRANMADPVQLSTNDMAIISTAVGTCGRRAIREGPAAGDALVKVLFGQVLQGKGVVEKGTPRVLIVLPSRNSLESNAVIEEAGLATATSTHMATKSESAPSKYDNPWEKIADVNLRRGSRYASLGFVLELRDLAREWNVDGVIINSTCSCRIYCHYPFKARDVIQEELGIPAIAFEYDAFDSREYTVGYYRSRVEPFAEVLRQRKKHQRIGR